jgi:PEP-utilising enzyme, mobile domain/Pyruvate phosphate dikinase, AMP/ATP-binding domain
LPTIATQLRDVLAQLEREFGDVQDVEFTIEDGRLYILQTRTAKRTPRAALRIAIDLVHEGLITPPQALRRLDGIELGALTHYRLLETHDPIARGVGASSGVASGRAAFDSAGAKRLSDSGDPVILVRPDTNTADVAGFAVSAGIVTVVGGSTAHAALVARRSTSGGARSSRKGPKTSWRKSNVGGNRQHPIPDAYGSTRQPACRCPDAAGPPGTHLVRYGSSAAGGRDCASKMPFRNGSKKSVRAQA